MIVKARHVFFLALITLPLLGKAQNDVGVYGDNNVWFLLLNEVDLSEKWSVTNEIHFRRNDWMNEMQQWIIRPCINYHPLEGLTASLGYSFVKTYPYGEYPLPIAVPENNIWEQITLHHDIAKRVNFHHRFRLENRWIGRPEYDPNQGNWEIRGAHFTNRFRYRLTATFKLFEIDEVRNVYVQVFDEIWFHLDKSLRVEDFDRNWFYLGMGYRFHKDVRFEVAYLDQWAVRPFGTEHNPTLQFSVFYFIPLLSQ